MNYTFIATLLISIAHKSVAGFGEPHAEVQILNDDNFEAAINDPANGLWLLKFYGKIRSDSLLNAING